MSGRNKSKVGVHMTKPEAPKFLQRMREQIVANEDAQRRELSQKRRRERGSGGDRDPEDDFTVVKVNEEDLTEEEYKRMKLELETQYKLDSDTQPTKHEELDVDNLIQTRLAGSGASRSSSDLKEGQRGDKEPEGTSGGHEKLSKKETSKKKLFYGSSSEDDDDG